MKCTAPRELGFGGLGGPRCGAPAYAETPGGPRCVLCLERFKKAMRDPATMINILRWPKERRGATEDEIQNMIRVLPKERD